MTQAQSLAMISMVISVGCVERNPVAPAEIGAPRPVAVAVEGDAPRLTADAQKPIRVVHGTIEAQFLHGTMSLQGTQGFRFDATLGDGMYPDAICLFTPACTPGSTVPLLGEWAGLDLFGTAKLRGKPFWTLVETSVRS